MRLKRFSAILVFCLLVVSFAVGNYATGQTATKRAKWDYSIVRHSPHMTESGSDFKKLRRMGSKGWELAASYPAKGEVIYSIFKRKR